MDTGLKIRDCVEIARDFEHRYPELCLDFCTDAVVVAGREPANAVSIVIQAGRCVANDIRLAAAGIGSFRGFPLVVEESRLGETNWAGDALRRAFGFTPHRAWEAWPGSLLEVEGNGGRGGTLGCYVRDQSRKNYFALTCGHVLPPVGVGHGHVVTTRAQRRDRRRVIGTVFSASVPEIFTTADAGLVKVRAGIGVNIVPKIGRIQTTPVSALDLRLGEEVSKFGFRTGLTHGFVNGPRIPKSNRLAGIAAGLSLSIEIVPRFSRSDSYSFSKRGDSGALVTTRPTPDQPPFAVGILTMSSGDDSIFVRAYCSVLDAILESAHLELY